VLNNSKIQQQNTATSTSDVQQANTAVLSGNKHQCCPTPITVVFGSQAIIKIQQQNTS
jgi:hypothetical protein